MSDVVPEVKECPKCGRKCCPAWRVVQSHFYPKRGRALKLKDSAVVVAEVVTPEVMRNEPTR